MSNAPLRRDLPKVGIVGAGQVGSALAYACLIRDTAPIISLYDIDKLRVDAQVADLAHGSIFAEPEVIGGADVSSMRDCDVIVITSGAPQKPGQSRLDLAGINAKIIADVMPKMLEVSPDALYVIVANPCDVLAVVAQKVSGLPTNRVFATGTGLDTARLRHLIARRAHVRERNVEAVMAGEHGDTEFALWSSARIGVTPILEWTDEQGNRPFTDASTNEIAKDVADAAYQVIAGKGSTNYAIGLSGSFLLDQLLSATPSMLPVSSILDDYYGISDVALSVPTLISNQGIVRPIEVPMTDREHQELTASANVLKGTIKSIGY
ncbi:L-lactate dehydrogenase [Propionibacterium freudenreichii]|uniref:L-lactate dehydrogenase n=1 Tax=Propionibacterium freudenreichii subsp. freudenreichii TaxID=66712 RepID=A0A0B7NPP4_PROFF|nr:L-lactate dehydrogenase [Propionibacterium freudenreichii]CEP25840.1 L-lactate dehydrogenase [Propionibacterium freudenreichii subsp. freudenreichii]MDK9348576.1 L-lactate dehydrogenase [Propionibacterium freudenreichii]MDK9352427.1 L-lactate dehydrogenase [Propionibacterium freudenreichii]MDK9627424.1 L-lactate dehydrogenase [Propionibacterium freudenreichii]MDK9645618.1 L-lactate dehydrogenase [Propionibacterium freudenreichii]